MGAALVTITIGGILVYSALKGISITEVFSGNKGKPLDPAGSSGGGDFGGGDFGTPGGDAQGGEWSPPLGSSGRFRGPKAALLNRLAGIAVNDFDLTITSTTGGRHVFNSLHFAGRAFDASGAPADMSAYSRYVVANHAAEIEELIYNDGGNGFAIADGKIVNGSSVYSGVWGGHRDHVHTGA